LEYLNLALNNLASVRVRVDGFCVCVWKATLATPTLRSSLSPIPQKHSQGLARCERMARLDLSANFIRPARLRRSVAALARAPALQEVWLVGNPCMRTLRATSSSPHSSPSPFGPWCPATSTDAAAAAAARAYVVVRLPRLACLDGVPVRPSERAAAGAALPALEAALAAIEAAEQAPPPPPPPLPPSSPGALSVADSDSSGYDAAEAAALEAEVDALLAEQAEAEGPSDGLPSDGPPTAWTRADRLAEVRAKEARAARAAAEQAASDAAREAATEGSGPRPGRHTAFPPLPDDDEEEGGGGGDEKKTRTPIRQVNEGRWAYTLCPGEPGGPTAHCIVLELPLGKGVPPGDVRLDVAPSAVRVLVAARSGGGGSEGSFSSSSTSIPPSFLLQLALPARVLPPASTAARSRASGTLVVTMPRSDPGGPLDAACVREDVRVAGKNRGGGGGGCAAERCAAVAAVVAGGEDAPPPLAG
jgi:hypothetical protein